MITKFLVLFKSKDVNKVIEACISAQVVFFQGAIHMIHLTSQQHMMYRIHVKLLYHPSNLIGQNE